MGDWIHESLHDLVPNELAPYRNEANAVSIRGDDVQLQPRVVVALGMLIHELTINAVKYGALSTPGGQGEVFWQSDEADSAGRLRFSWTELDGPPITQRPTRSGMGSQLLKTLAVGLDGTADLEYGCTGVRCIIDVPWKRDEARE